MMMSNSLQQSLIWVEIDKKNIRENLRLLRTVIHKNTLLAPSVKANAYGHGLVLFSKIAWNAGADWLCVNSLWEAEILRKNGVKAPLYIMGYVAAYELADAILLGCRLVIYNKETVRTLGELTEKLNRKVRVHIKLETGNHRQGIFEDDLLEFVRGIQPYKKIEIEGIATHFANIEDIHPKSPHRKYPARQLEHFRHALALLESHGIHIPIRHASNSASTLLYPETHFDLVRPGIAAYGLWPSVEVKRQFLREHPGLVPKPVLSWKTRVAQIKIIPKGAAVGYGCTYHTKRKTRLAILPIGYYDGFDRGFSNNGSVLIHGKRAPVIGRVCMNITMVDVTDIPGLGLEDSVTLLGRDGKDEISAEELAERLGTINYEITTRIREGIPRLMV